jgi:glycosyltransferase involved in cell wall biosynthesis
VRIVGKTPQEQMAGLYAQHDVLLAPSIWPESYGLVAREALAAGLWVLASDRGAMGEDVVPGVNGWTIDVSTPAALLAALSEIDREPARYLASPPPTRLRTSDEQAADLLRLYAEVLASPPPRAPVSFPTWAGQPARDRSAPDRLRSFRRKQSDARWGGS